MSSSPVILAPVVRVVENAQAAFRKRLERVEASGDFTAETYGRYLVMQHHLTNGVQRHFLAIAAHPALSGRRSLRQFLFEFAMEEEPHFQIAARDLEALGQPLGPSPLEVEMWWAYFDRAIVERPFVRLGATCVLENLGPGAKATVKKLLSAPFLTPKCTRFLQIHLHEELPHGSQIYEALADARLEPAEVDDLARGARIGATLYLRMVDWVFRTDAVTREVEG